MHPRQLSLVALLLGVAPLPLCRHATACRLPCRTSSSSWPTIWASTTWAATAEANIHAQSGPTGGGRYAVDVRLLRPAHLLGFPRGDPHRQAPRAPASDHVLAGASDCPSQKLLHPVIRQQLPLEETTWPNLKAAGYATACIGKWHLGGEGSAREQGFDVYHPGKAVTTPSATEGGKGEYDLTAQAEKFIEANRDRPFFLYLAHNSPHIPYSAKETLVARTGMHSSRSMPP